VGDSDDSKREMWKELGGKETLARLKKIEAASRRADRVVNELLKPKKQPDEISDFGPIAEDSDDQEFSKQSEALKVVEKSFFEKFLLNEVINTASGVIKVNNLLQMWLHKRRYRIARQRIILIQTQYRLYQRRKLRARARIALLDEERVKRM
jgi:hypothetical protein